MNLQLSLHAANLTNPSNHRTSNLFATVSLISDASDSRTQILGKTEVVKNTRSPDWIKTFPFHYDLDVPLRLAISILDIHKRKQWNISMGSAVFEVGSILSTKGHTQGKMLKHGGVIYARIDEVFSHSHLQMAVRISNVKLKRPKHFCYELARRDSGVSGRQWNIVHRSDMVKGVTPNWNVEVITLSVLCGEDLELPICLKVLECEEHGKNHYMGHIETTVNGLLGAKNHSHEFPLQMRDGGVGKLVIRMEELIVTEELETIQILPLPDVVERASLQERLIAARVMPKSLTPLQRDMVCKWETA